MRTNCVSLNDWLDSQADEFHAVWADSTHLTYNYNTQTGVAVITNLRSGKTVSTKCNPKKFNLHRMLGMAWASYKGEELPKTSGLLELRIAKNALHPLDYNKRLVVYKGRTCKLSFGPLCDNYIATDIETRENYKISPLAYVQIVY